MKNKLTLLMTLVIILTIGFGCSQFTGGGSQTGTNANEMAKTGVAECDQFIDMLNSDSKSPDEGIIQRKVREYAIDIAKEAIKQEIEKNQGDKEKIALGCKEAKEQYLKDKNKGQENSNSAK